MLPGKFFDILKEFSFSVNLSHDFEYSIKLSVSRKTVAL